MSILRNVVIFTIIAYGSVCLHEIGHIIALVLAGGKLEATGIAIGLAVPLGAYVKVSEVSQFWLPLIALAGPLVNFMLAVTGYKLYQVYESEVCRALGLINSFLCITNVTPAVLIERGQVKGLISTDGSIALSCATIPIVKFMVILIIVVCTVTSIVLFWKCLEEVRS